MGAVVNAFLSFANAFSTIGGQTSFRGLFLSKAVRGAAIVLKP